MRSQSALTLLAITSIILAVAIWPIICYNFVSNCMQLVLGVSSMSKVEKIQYDNTEVEIAISHVAMQITIYLGLIICEGIMVVCLVLQFMSSFDFLVGSNQEFGQTWLNCHKRIFLLNAIILGIKVFIFLNSSSILDSAVELYAIVLNFVFLILFVFVCGEFLEASGNRNEPSNNFSPSAPVNNSQLNIVSFLENDNVNVNADEKCQKGCQSHEPGFNSHR